MNEVVVEVEIVIALAILVVLVIGFRIWSLIMFKEEKILFFLKVTSSVWRGRRGKNPRAQKVPMQQSPLINALNNFLINK
jgi:hypothetical protein